MTRKDIIRRIVEITDVKQIDVSTVVHKTFDVIIDALSQGKKLELRNFGVFKIKTRKPRIARNPKTGEKVPLGERKVVVFRPGLVMKQKVK